MCCLLVSSSQLVVKCGQWSRIWEGRLSRCCKKWDIRARTSSGGEECNIHVAAMRGVWPGFNGRVDDMFAGHRQGSFTDSGPWDQWPSGGSLVQPQPQLWRGDEQPASFQNVAGAGVPDDMSRDSGYVRPAVWDMGLDWTWRRRFPTVLPRQQKGPTVAHEQRQLPKVPSQQQQLERRSAQQQQPLPVPSRQRQVSVMASHQPLLWGAQPNNMSPPLWCTNSHK